MSTLLDKLAYLGDYSVFTATVVLLVVAGFVQGMGVNALTFSLFGMVITVVWLDAALAGLMFSAFLMVSAVAMIPELTGGEAEDLPREGEKLTAVVPVYRDSEVLEGCVESLLGSRYRDLEVLIVCEEDDRESIAEAKRLSGCEKVGYTINRSSPGSKAGAINHAVEMTDSPLIAVFDADQTVSPGFISHAVQKLSGRDIVQGRRIPRPEGMIESLSYYENMVFWLSAALFNRIGFRLALSQATVMHRSVFEEVGGYDPEMVTEDIEFGHRCYQQGVDVEHVQRHPTYLDAPHTLRDLWGQKKRWVIGSIQAGSSIARRMLLGPLDLRKAVSLLVLGGAVIGNGFILTLVPKLVILLFLGHLEVAAMPLATLMIISLAYRTRDSLKGEVSGVGKYWMLSPLVYGLYGLIAIKGVTEFLFTWEGEWYHVSEKKLSADPVPEV